MLGARQRVLFLAQLQSVFGDSKRPRREEQRAHADDHADGTYSERRPI
jgi:hypothetical protein